MPYNWRQNVVSNFAKIALITARKLVVRGRPPDWPAGKSGCAMEKKADGLLFYNIEIA
jgi:hypothetical protein